MKDRDPKNIIAGIDLGTNSARLMVVDISDGRILGQTLITTKLGESLAFSDRISFQAMNRTFVALSELKRVANEEYNASRIRAFCTEALRKAKNRSEFIDRVSKNLDIKLELIGGVREAEYVFKGIYYNRRISLNLNNSLIVDIGGGSTEFIYIKDSNIEFMKSVDIGALILTERYLESDPPRAEEFNRMEDRIISRIGFLDEIKDCKLIGLGGSITTLSAMNMNLRTYRADNIDGSKITLRRCKKLLWDLRSVPVEDRKNIISFDNDRAEIIVAGATILVNIMEKVQARSVTVSETGILYGYIMEEFGGTSDR